MLLSGVHVEFVDDGLECEGGVGVGSECVLCR